MLVRIALYPTGVFWKVRGGYLSKAQCLKVFEHRLEKRSASRTLFDSAILRGACDGSTAMCYARRVNTNDTFHIQSLADKLLVTKSSAMDAAVLETEKENIAPVHTGRNALKLGKALLEPRSRPLLLRQRSEFEKQILLEELDDPLQAYIDYIEWTHNHYPQGSNAESGLLVLLEKCTSQFRDTPYYKNDPRYLKVWLEYAQYSDSPRDIFVYLARKSIGQELALFYEEFAKFLEAKGLMVEAREVYEIGEERQARPLTRLSRAFTQFKARAAKTTLPQMPSQIRSMILTKRPVSLDLPSLGAAKRLKLNVHVDDAPKTIKELVFTDETPANLNLALASKENKVSARPWAGETLKQNCKPHAKPAKFEVFRDDHVQLTSSHEKFNQVQHGNQVYTIIQQPGKIREKLSVNLNLLYPADDEEYCLAEILALSKRFQRCEPAGQTDALKAEIIAQEYTEQNQTFTIPLRDDDTVNQTHSPTMTLLSRAATNEVMGIFNRAAHLAQLDDESVREFEELTNYEGFETEKLTQPGADFHAQTPPTDQYESDAASSPFLEQP